MYEVYLNDPDGRKECTLSDLSVGDQSDNLNKSKDFLCNRFIECDTDNVFFAQNLTTHLAYILSFVKLKTPNLSGVYMSDHEISWIKKTLEVLDYTPDNTHSNYHLNEKIKHPAFDVKIFPFDNFEKKVAAVRQPSIFYISHVSRLSGEIFSISSAYQTIKEASPDSILIVDGAQSLGAMERFDIENNCDVYLGLSSKFIGAEPHLGFAFMSRWFFQKYVLDVKNYPTFDVKKYSKDVFSLWNSLKYPIFESDFVEYIKKLKKYAVKRFNFLRNETLYIPAKQSPHFLTLNFGSTLLNKRFVDFAAKKGIALSDNSGWCISEPKIPLVRVGLSVRVTELDVDILADTVYEYIKKRQSD